MRKKQTPVRVYTFYEHAAAPTIISKMNSTTINANPLPRAGATGATTGLGHQGAPNPPPKPPNP
jgi:hypothetical protein